ncbi:MAG: ketol-acid reductoisomerase [Candidatus Spyradosoma sp.]
MATKKATAKKTPAAPKAAPAKKACGKKACCAAKSVPAKKATTGKKIPVGSVKVYHEKDADLGVLAGKTVAVLGYGAQGRAQALCMRDSGVNVIIGVRAGKSFKAAKADGFEVLPVDKAAKKADIIHLLLPDEKHKEVYEAQIRKFVTPGKTLCCSHGFAYVFKTIVPPEGVDVIMVAPKGPGTEVRRVFEEGFGCPGLVAVFQDASGTALQTALAIAKAEGLTRGGVLECTMEQETYEDLFGEQNVLCGGLVDLMKYGFETLTEAGYPPEMAYFECVHEAKLIVDIIYNKGIAAMNAVISNTAEFGEYYNGPKIITPDVKKRMKESLERIQSGKFAKDWLKEAAKGAPTLAKKREQLGKHTVEIVGNEIRKMFERK